MLKKLFSWPFRRLQRKLTLSYTLATLVTILLIEVLFIGIALTLFGLNTSRFLLQSLVQEAQQAPPYFVHGTPDRAGLAAWLQIASTDLPTKQGPFQFAYPLFFTVLDSQGQTIASLGSHPSLADSTLQTQISPQNYANLNAVLQHTTGTTGITAADTGNTVLAIAPIINHTGKIVGALAIKTQKPGNIQLFTDVVRFFFATLILIAIFATFLGIISGYITARSLTRRLKGLSQASNRWSLGDFSPVINDASEDELGQTAQQLNHMAKELHNLLLERQKLATLEERNRLARDLHDSVKQQIFAVSMQVGATKVLLRRDVDAAEVRLNETEKLVRMAQQELTSLIRELRPAALEDKGLVAALRELVIAWAQQTTIVANLNVDGNQPLALTVEETLFRIVQEALANVARHSKATLVQINVTITDDTVTLSILDNGQGFDTTLQNYQGVGLHSMQERMKTLGGSVQIESSPDKGTQIIVQCNRAGIGSGNAPQD
jgi:signal transduction histidine kinase